MAVVALPQLDDILPVTRVVCGLLWVRPDTARVLFRALVVNMPGSMADIVDSLVKYYQVRIRYT